MSAENIFQPGPFVNTAGFAGDKQCINLFNQLTLTITEPAIQFREE